jgi:murein DD-endopeptidase MepM/ murein hydrolase activator NlpD
MVRVGDRWLAPLAASLQMKPDRYPVVAGYTAGDQTREVASTLTVKERKYPLQRLTMARSTAARYTHSGVKKERETYVAALRNGTDEPLWRGLFSIPTAGRFSTAFGVRRIRNGTVRYRHAGADIAGPEGRVIVAANHGVVRLSDEFILFGKTVILDHGAGVATAYLHMSRLDVKVGQAVRRGTPLGRMGATGAATGPHLHWSLYVRGVPVDPVQWTKDRGLAMEG